MWLIIFLLFIVCTKVLFCFAFFGRVVCHGGSWLAFCFAAFCFLVVLGGYVCVFVLLISLYALCLGTYFLLGGGGKEIQAAAGFVYC